MATYKVLLAQESPEVQSRVAGKVEVLRRDIALSPFMEALNISQTELAKAMGIKLPSVARMEQPDYTMKTLSLEQYFVSRVLCFHTEPLDLL